MHIGPTKGENVRRLKRVLGFLGTSIVGAVLACTCVVTPALATDFTIPAESTDIASYINTTDDIKDGDTVTLNAGNTYKSSSNITKLVNIEGNGATVNGYLYYRPSSSSDVTTVSINGVNIKGGSDSNADQGIWFGGSNAKDIRIEISNSSIDGYKFGIGVSSGASGCSLSVSSTSLSNVFCGVSWAEASNGKIVQFDVTTDGNVPYMIQSFTGVDNSNGYYASYEQYVADEDGTLNNGSTYGIQNQMSTIPKNGNASWDSSVTVLDKNGNVQYVGSLKDSVERAQGGETIRLDKNVELGSRLAITKDGITLDLNGHTISAADNFDTSVQNGTQLIGVDGADNVIIKGGSIVTGSKNSYALNIYDCSGARLEDLKLDTSKSGVETWGYSLVVNSSSVEVSGTLATGGINVDSRESGKSAELAFADNARVTFADSQAVGIVVENYQGESSTVSFGNGVSISGGADGFLPVYTGNAEDVEIKNPENAGLIAGENGVYGKPIAFVGEQGYLTLAAAVDNANGQKVTLNDDVILNEPIAVDGKNVVIDGKGHTISLGGAKAAFNDIDENNLDGIKSGSVTVTDTHFVGKGNGSYVAIVGFNADGVKVSLSGCSFEDFFATVLCNPVSDSSVDNTVIHLTGNTYVDGSVDHAVSIDDGATAGALVNKHEVTVEDDAPESETFAVAAINNVGYRTLEEAVAAAQDNDVISLLSNVTVSKPMTITADNVTLNGNGHTVTAANDITTDLDNDSSSLLTVTGKGAAINNVTLKGGNDTRHVLNIWCADSATLTDVALDRTNRSTRGGAPLVINNTDVTVHGKFDITAGVGSWYGINLDNKYGETALTFDEDAKPTFTDLSGQGLAYICAENSAKPEDGGYGLGNPSVTNNNPLIQIPEDGKTLHVHTPSADRQGVVAATCTEAGYTGDIVCTECGVVLEEGTSIQALGHNLTRVPAKAPTATEPGNLEYWYCDACKGYFKDAAGTQQYTGLDAVTIPAAGEPVENHTVVFKNGSEVVATVIVPDGQTIPADMIPADPEWDGNEFAGWYIVGEDGSVTKVNLDEFVVNDDVVLDALFYVNDDERPVKPEAPKADAGKSGLAKTSDPTTFLPAVVAAAAGVTTVAGAAVLRKRQR